MNPNSTDPTNTPPTDESAPQTTPPAEVPATSPDATPAPDATTETPVAPAAPTTPSPFGSPVSTETPTIETPTNLGAAPTPAPTEAPAQSPFGAAPVGSPTPGAQGPKNKKLPLIIGIVAGAIVLIAVAVVLFLMFTTVSKQDYRDAAVKFNDVSSASTQLNVEAASLGRSISGSTSDSDFEASLTEAKDAVAKLSTQNDELSKLKAVRVGEGAELYKTFDDKLEAYVDYANGLVTSVENLRPAMKVCSGASDATDNSARVKVLKDCSTALGNIKDLPNESFKTFVDKMKTAYASYATTFEKMAAITAPFGAQAAEYRALRTEMTETQSTIVDASSDFTKSLRDSDDKFSPKESADALAKYLTEKQRD